MTEKRNSFVKQFALSDGSFTAVAYSMPVHYKKKGVWKEINTTLVKSGKKQYKTKSTDLSIKVSKKANKKSMISLKRGSDCLSWSLNGKKMKAVNVKISNPKKTKQTDVLNQNVVSYPKVLKIQASPITFSQNVCRKLLRCRKSRRQRSGRSRSMQEK